MQRLDFQLKSHEGFFGFFDIHPHPLISAISFLEERVTKQVENSTDSSSSPAMHLEGDTWKVNTECGKDVPPCQHKTKTSKGKH